MGFTLQPAVKEDFVDREEIIREMISTTTDKNIKMGFALVGPRRIGKTSILREVESRLKARDDVVVIYFSLWDLIENTVFEFCNKLTYAIVENFKGKLAKKYKIQHFIKVPTSKIFDFLRTIDFKITVLQDMEMTLRLGKKKSPGVDILMERVFTLIENLSKEVAVRSILILDEFPSIMDLKEGQKLGEGIIKKIRTMQEGFENTLLCISGSIRKTMELAVLSPSSAFYRQFIVKNIGPFDKRTVNILMTKNLSKEISEEAIAQIFELTQGIPFYVQFIGRELSRLETPKIEFGQVRQAFENLLREEGSVLFTEEFKALSDKERSILSKMAINELESANDISKAAEENSNVISRYLNYFLEKGIIERKNKGKYHFVDPVYKEWIKYKYGDLYL